MNNMIPNSKQKCLSEPFGNIGRGTGWNRYHPFQLISVGRGVDPHNSKKGVKYEDKCTWNPYHKSYEAIWSAILYGHYGSVISSKKSKDTPRMIFDMFTGEIVWQNYNKECKETYFYKGYGTK